MKTSGENDSSITSGNSIRIICYESEIFETFQYTVDDMLLAASMAATVFNVMVTFCAAKLFRKSGDTMHLFIISMTLGDLLLTVFCHPNEFLTRKHEFLRNDLLCMIIHFCNWLGLAVSGLSLTMLNIDKLIYFQWPLSYDRAMSKNRAIIFCTAIWMTDKKRYFYEFFMVVFCVLPVTSSAIVSGYLYRLTREKRNASVRSLVFIFATTTWTSFSLLPYRIFNICRIHLFEWNTIECVPRQQLHWLAWTLLYLLTLNPIINPLITALIYTPYRLTIKKFLINIPIGNRPIYNYRTDVCTDTRFRSLIFLVNFS
ncbi:unnamed protein product [Dracunculus medinensis]|uniref:G_PROTEIN_RECEP_F1_2 domain-containing protein n=1 Tax=Dracunculus medinensis TaxID=318479 RepID=A0A0N4U8V9_DRAME|nr:unnamed protein product [Dracunculus medinensis]